MYLLYFIIFYIIIKLKINKYASITHSIISFLWLFYIFIRKLKFNLVEIFSYKMIEFVDEKISKNLFLEKTFYTTTEHSIGYFISDSVFLIKSKDYKYIFHHLLSVLMLSNIYLGSSISTAGLFYAELGGIFHHFKIYQKKVSNKYLKILIIISYFFVYGFSRILMLSNGINYLIKTTKISDKIQLFLMFPLLFQNLLWLYTNWKKDKKFLYNYKGKKILLK